MVDILMAVYNGQRYVEEQLQSILNQTVRDWRLIIQDDASSDDTWEVVQRYASRWFGADSRIFRDKAADLPSILRYNNLLPGHDQIEVFSKIVLHLCCGSSRGNHIRPSFSYFYYMLY